MVNQKTLEQLRAEKERTHAQLARTTVWDIFHRPYASIAWGIIGI